MNSPNPTVSWFFEEQVGRSPESPALVLSSESGDAAARSISYAELNGRANALAARLSALGVTEGDVVALLLNRSAEMIVGMLAALKCGACYLPLDPSWPDDRLSYMMANANVRLCVTLSSHAGHADSLGATAVAVDTVADCATAFISHPVGADAAAYVMYTSGSTGRPKGVVVPQRGITRLVKGQSYARLDETRALLHLAPVTFDASTFEIWGALLNGGRCVIAPAWKVPEPAKLAELITATGITTAWLTASLFNTIVDHAPGTLASVEELLVGGEALSVPHVRRAQELLPRTQLVNGYGPTEGTTFTCCHRIPRPVPADQRSIPIGHALARTSAHVLGADFEPAPAGSIGELFIGGDGVALGYVNSPSLTAERFVTHPRLGRLYRTGDRVRSLSDGTLDFIGRLDDQVKVNGHRIEPAEIEAALRLLPGVADAVVCAREDNAERRLVAYYTALDCIAGPTASTLRAGLGHTLPEHMVPSKYVLLDSLPVTVNGKVDRQALPAPGGRRPALQHAAVAARTPLERWIADLWMEVLHLDDVGIHDRFFDLGGTSLAALRFLGRLNAAASIPVPAVVLFRAPTIAELARILEREHAQALPAFTVEAGRQTAPADERISRRHDELRGRRLQRKRAS